MNQHEKLERQRNRWTQEEIDYISEVWGERTIPQIAQHLRRSINSVKVKSVRLGYTGQKWYGNMMSARKVSELLGVDVHTVTDYWIPKCGLKAKARRLGNSKKTTTIIMFDDLLLWLEAHPELWDSRRLELYALGMEYEWLIEKRKADAILPVRKAQKWTPEEDARLIALFKRGNMTYSEIGAQLGRSRNSVERRLSRLDVWGTGEYIGDMTREKRKAKGTAFEKLALIIRLRNALLTYQNSIEFGEYWQKDMCMNWSDTLGCTAGCNDCDYCSKFLRIRPQYCVRCGATFYERTEHKYCERCRIARKKQAQRKWAILSSRGR